MAKQRIIKSVLHNVLGAYTSRHSEYEGYWLFGFLVSCFEHGIAINLLLPQTELDQPGPLAVATHLAVQKFTEQIEKAGLDLSLVQSAFLEIAKSSYLRTGTVNGHSLAGYDVRFAATAVSDLGKVYQCEVSVFVAPHNPTVEHKSAR